MSDIIITGCNNIDLLVFWRIHVLRCVFSIPENMDTAELECSNRNYYEQHLADSSHIACIASIENEVIGCGGICFYEEMPSPDNRNGRCAYLMNIYVSEQFRGQGTAKRIVRWLVGQALAQGVGKIYLETSDMARQLYGGLGFNYMKNMMRLEA